MNEKVKINPKWNPNSAKSESKRNRGSKKVIEKRENGKNEWVKPLRDSEDRNNRNSSVAGIKIQQKVQSRRETNYDERREGGNGYVNGNRYNHGDGEKVGTIQREYLNSKLNQPDRGVSEESRLGEMKRSARIVGPFLHWREPSPAVDHLLENSDFLVVGVIGQQGVGKSSLMSLLGGSTWRDKRFHFRPQGFEAKERGCHMTNGVEMFITAERLILLDTQPVMSLSVLDELVQNDRDRRHGTGGGAPDLASGLSLHQIQSLQLCAWLMSVCHVLLVLHDQAPDLNLIRLLTQAEMLKPQTQAPDGTDNCDFSPEIVFVMNRACRDLYQPANYMACETILSAMTKYSKLKVNGHFGSWRKNLMLELPRDENPLNLFLVPSANDRCRNPAYPSFELTIRSLRNLVLSYPRNNQPHNFERVWFSMAARGWEQVKKSQMMAEYARHLGDTTT